MKIISNFSKDTKTSKRIPGSYEWWYFDAQSADGYKLVIIFYEGNPFSRRYINAQGSTDSARAEQFPAVSISLYKNGQPIYYSFEEVEKKSANFSPDSPKGHVKENTFEGLITNTDVKYEVSLNQTLINGDSIQANLVFSTEKKSQPKFPSDLSNPESHEWNLIMPSCSVVGDIMIGGYQKEEITFEGSGYHDHNVGFEPLKESFTEWYWGRYHLSDSTFIYYLMNKKGDWEKKAWIIQKDGEVHECDHIELNQFGLSIFGLQTARVIQAMQDKTEIYLQLDELLDSGPFYQRFGGRLIVHEEGVVKEARGISEYIKPARIYDRKFWPLVNMRITYPGKQHWVQKNPTLFRWTW